MALTREFEEAVSQYNLLRVKIMLKDSLLLDTSFDQFNEMLNYAETKLSGIWISNDEDDEVFSQSPEELNTILAGLVNNFSKRRVTHLMGMINKLYPLQLKMKQESRREATVVIQKKRETDREYRGIKNDISKMLKMRSKISSKNQIDIKDAEALRNVAMSIVAHCDKIIGK